MQNLLSHLKLSTKISIFIRLLYLFSVFIHINCIENNLYIAIRLKLLNLNIGAWKKC